MDAPGAAAARTAAEQGRRREGGGGGDGVRLNHWLAREFGRTKTESAFSRMLILSARCRCQGLNTAETDCSGLAYTLPTVTDGMPPRFPIAHVGRSTASTTTAHHIYRGLGTQCRSATRHHKKQVFVSLTTTTLCPGSRPCRRLSYRRGSA